MSMKKGFEELKNLDYELVVSKAHIMQSTLEHIINKRFESLNPVKAKGFVKILEREFDLDLSDWMREFDAYYSIKEPEISTIDKLNAEALKDGKKSSSKLTLSIFVVAAIGAIGFFVYLQKNSLSEDVNGSASLQNEINESNASMAFNISFDANSSDINGSKELNATEHNKTVVVPEVNTTKPIAAATAVQGNFFVEPSKKVWIGIRYMDTNKSKWFETVAEHRFDFNSSREQLVAFGHSQVKVVTGASATASKQGGKIRYHYKNGKLREIGEEEYNKLSGKTDTNSTKPKQ
jgi:cytoskeletal protein RodZ